MLGDFDQVFSPFNMADFLTPPISPSSCSESDLSSLDLTSKGLSDVMSWTYSNCSFAQDFGECDDSGVIQFLEDQEKIERKRCDSGNTDIMLAVPMSSILPSRIIGLSSPPNDHNYAAQDVLHRPSVTPSTYDSSSDEGISKYFTACIIT